MTKSVLRMHSLRLAQLLRRTNYAVLSLVNLIVDLVIVKLDPNQNREFQNGDYKSL